MAFTDTERLIGDAAKNQVCVAGTDRVGHTALLRSRRWPAAESKRPYAQALPAGPPCDWLTSARVLPPHRWR